MAIMEKKPPIKETVGAQYICFAKAAEQWNGSYEEEVEKTETVKSVKVTENAEGTDVYASGKVYDTNYNQASTDIEVEAIAFVAETRAKMRGELVDAGGLVLSGGNTERPFFAYGKVVKLKGDNIRMEWYPKCKLSSNSDDAKTRESGFSEQNDTFTIKAYPYDENGNVKAYVESTMTGYPEGLTEDKFFAKPILKKEDLAAAVASIKE